MFDNQTNPASGQVPGNLPVSEPDDMFSAAPEGNPEPATSVQPNPEPIPAMQANSEPTALSAGVLRAKPNPEQIMMAPTNPVPTNYGQTTITEGLRPEENMMRDPFGGRKVLITVITLLSLGILGGGGAWIYFSFIKETPSIGIVPAIVPETVPTVAPVIVPVVTPTEDITTTTLSTTANSPSSSDQRILFGEPVLDTDSDGLDDATEKKISTNMLAWDSDADGLSDGDEVLTWKTDPLKSDTDADGYTDGAEIKNCYNPKGSGKLFSPPTSESTTTTPN